MAAASNGLVLLRFHLGAGVRVAWRTLVPLAVGVTAASVIAGDPRVVLAAVAVMLVPPVPSIGSAVALMVVCTGAAGACLVVVSHDLTDLAPLADRALTLREGRCYELPELPVGTQSLPALERLARGSTTDFR